MFQARRKHYFHAAGKEYISQPQKTVLRKVEEALLVWLIESNHLSSKERMFEVYLNIIEWALNVYGIGEASRFYFDKSPAQLTLPECMFLSKLIPSPKAFRYRFNERGELKDYMASHFKFMAGRMVSRNWLAAEDTIGLPVKLASRDRPRTISSSAIPAYWKKISLKICSLCPTPSRKYLESGVFCTLDSEKYTEYERQKRATPPKPRTA